MPPWNRITRVGGLQPALHVRDHTLALSFSCGENIYLFGPDGGLQLIHESLRATNKSQIMATKANKKSRKLTVFLILLLILFQKPILGQDTRCFS